MPQDLEDTLKAIADPNRTARNMSSPPGIGGEMDEEEDGDQVHPLASSYQEVQLRKQKIPASQSADDIAKVHIYTPGEDVLNGTIYIVVLPNAPVFPFAPYTSPMAIGDSVFPPPPHSERQCPSRHLPW